MAENMELPSGFEKTLQSMRTKIQRNETEMGDPMSAFDQMHGEMDQLQASVRGIRHFSPMMGDLADTLAACVSLCARMAEQVKAASKEQKGASVSPSVSSPADGGHPLPGGSSKQPPK